MRAVVQRVTSAKVEVDNQIVGQISHGLLVLIGVEKGDTEKDVKYLVNKLIGLRIFEDSDGKMNLAIGETQGSILAVSQFTLLGDVRKGRRPSFITAADPETGNNLYENVVVGLRTKEIHVETGRFQADMQVNLVNDGPVTILLDSRKIF
ncbi:D-aminoacyl-tRNA deacylase [bacterium]|nr:D-aminoacyl-tRNA deacylase [bacterium]